MRRWLPKVFLGLGGALLFPAALLFALDLSILTRGFWGLVVLVLVLLGGGLVVVGFRLSPPNSKRAGTWFALTGGVVLGILACVGLAWLAWTGYVADVRRTDAFFREVLGLGDAKTAYDTADARLRARYTREQFLSFAEKNPYFLRRDKLGRAELWRWTEQGEDVAAAAVPWNGSYILYTYGPENKRLLFGISPGLEAAAPAWVLQRLEQQRQQRP